MIAAYPATKTKASHSIGSCSVTVKQREKEKSIFENSFPRINKI
jgi:hypothetical protein